MDPRGRSPYSQGRILKTPHTPPDLIPADQWYKYEPLKDAENFIRVLDLHRNTGDELQCTISQIPYRIGGYQALSYEWGGSLALSKINVRDFHYNDLGWIPLTTNLRDALQDLRDAPRLESKRFWIDQVSINQLDDEEKSRQVSSMDRIYTQATQVITYLGPKTGNLELEQRALDPIAHIQHHYRSNYDNYTRRNLSQLWYERRQLPVQDLPPDIDPHDEAWPFLIRIIYTGWLTRLWMVQENTLCETTRMMRGPSVLEWVSVAAIPFHFHLGCLSRTLLLHELPQFGFPGTPYDTCCSAITAWKMKTAGEGGDQSLVKNVDWHRAMDCKDPRDRFYALLGISADKEKLAIVPDYHADLKEVYIDVSARMHLHDTENLYLFRILGTTQPEPDPSMPSWAYYHVRNRGDIDYDQHPHPSPSSSIRFGADNVMVIQGQVVDSVEFSTVSTQVQIGAEPDEMNEYWANFYKLIIVNICKILNRVGVDLTASSNLVFTVAGRSHIPLDYSDLVDLCFNLWLGLFFWTHRVLAFDRRHGISNSDFKRIVMGYLTSLAELIKAHNDNKYGPILLDDPESQMSEELRKMALDATNAMNRLDHRVLMVSQQKRLVNATGRAKAGDAIALFAGGATAYVLRPVGGNAFRFVGTAYVHGIMAGELYKDVTPEQVDREIWLV